MNKFFFCFGLAAMLLFLGCGDNDKAKSTDNLFKFKEYISYTTYGNQSVASPIRIELTQPLEDYEINQKMADGIFFISPKTSGELLIKDNSTLIFTPDARLKPDTEYVVRLKLEKLYKRVPDDFKEFTFSFRTITPDFKVTLGNLQSYSKEYQYLEGTIRTSDIIDFAAAKKLISASQENQKLSIDWLEEGSAGSIFNFTIDSISRKIKDSQVTVTWDGDPIDSEAEGKNSLVIPGRNRFAIVEVNSSRGAQSSLEINFSDPLAPDQDFKGLVTLADQEDLRFEANGNVLNVYPQNALSGEIQVTVFKGIKNEDGFGLKNDFSEKVAFEQLKPAVRMLSKGVILPNAKQNPIYFEAVNLKSVDVRVIQIFEDNVLQFLQENNLNDLSSYNLKRVGRRVAKKTINLIENPKANLGSWKAHAVDVSSFFKSEPGALYRLEISFDQNQALFPCGDETAVELANQNLPDAEEELREEEYWDNLRYSYRNEVYNWRERENPCHPAYYNDEKTASTNLLGSDLGFIVKEANDGSYQFITTNLLTAQPAMGARVELYNYQQQLLHSLTTDREGIAEYTTDENIAFAIAKQNNDLAYAKLSDGNALSLSKFDVSGKELQQGLKGFTYTERGVHRPGDTIHLTFVLNDNANPLPKSHPVTLEVTDARGKLVHRKTLTKDFSSGGDAAGSGGNFYYFPITTASNAPTGNWRAKIAVGGAIFNKTLPVATVKPNRLKIKLDFKDEVLDASSPISGMATGTWLHGAPARNLKISMDATLTATGTPFENYKTFDFIDPVRLFTEVEIPILETELNSEGKITFSKKVELSKQAPGMLKATFLTKFFEGGGDFSIDVFSKNLAPYSHFVGLRSPEAKQYGAFDTDVNNTFDVVTLNAQGNPSGNREVEVHVFKIEWRWWWSRGSDNLSRYENTSVHRPVKNFTVKTDANGKASFHVNIPDDEGGRYLIRLIDKASGHATGRSAYFYQRWWESPDGGADNATTLVFSSEKKEYRVGDDAVITFPSSAGGRALISVENGSSVLQTQWFDTKDKQTKISIPLTSAMAPNVYVNISSLQPHEQTKNDLPIRLYGVIPVLVTNPKTVLEPQIKMPDVLRPERDFKVTVSEANNRPMTYTVAVVDEGLLDLTRFETPKIHESFYSREALGVRTFDIFDDVIGAYSGSVDNVFAIGGGDVAAGAKNRKADRFKPVVSYLGPFILAAGENATHTIKMPNYVGSVRTMVIAGNAKDAAYGKTEATTPVRTPLMVLASLPRKLSPGETVTLPVTVFAMEDKVKNATVSVKTSDALKPVGGSSKSVTFTDPGEQIVNFDFEVLPTTKFQTISVTASGGGEKASYNVEIDVENPNPISLRSKTITLQPNAEQDLTFTPFGVSGTNGATLEFSTLPPMNFTRRMEYLISYPHGCVEQTTSSAFPQLFLTEIFELTAQKKQDIQKNVKAAIKKLGDFQTTNGGLSYWPGHSRVDAWSTNYAGHFMLAAKEKGYALPLTFLSNWKRYQQRAARQWRNNSTRYNSSLLQAYRLYTLALAGSPELAAMNRLRESGDMSNDAKWRLAAAYALTGKTSIARELAQIANINFIRSNGRYYYYGSPFRNKAMALETMVILKDEQQRELSESLAKGLSSDRWYSTQETSYALMALAKMVEANGGKDLDVAFTKSDKTETITTDYPAAQRELVVTDGSNIITISNKKDNVVYVTLSQRGKLPVGEELTENKNLYVKTRFTFGGNQSIPVDKLSQGTEITAQITVNNTSMDNVDNIALTQIFPSGWEIVNTSFTELGGGATGNANYTDIRDDRVNFYFDLNSKKSKTFTVKLNASYLGRYYLPGTQVEAMYDEDYFARNKGQWVEVVE
ncbi:MAG: MG2 domain-containing protein [Leeuwenhoekiella sp.]